VVIEITGRSLNDLSYQSCGFRPLPKADEGGSGILHRDSVRPAPSVQRCSSRDESQTDFQVSRFIVA
jgi:hypothetical protein